MSEEQLKAFIEKLQGDDSLQEKLKTAADADAAVEIAKDAGFSISADDLKSAQSQILDKDLEVAAGGAGTASTEITRYEDFTAVERCCLCDWTNRWFLLSRDNLLRHQRVFIYNHHKKPSIILQYLARIERSKY